MLRFMRSRSGQKILIWSQRNNSSRCRAQSRRERGSGTPLPSSQTFEGEHLYKCLNSLSAHWPRHKFLSMKEQEARTESSSKSNRFSLDHNQLTSQRGETVKGSRSQLWMSESWSFCPATRVEREGVFVCLPGRHLTVLFDRYWDVLRDFRADREITQLVFLIRPQAAGLKEVATAMSEILRRWIFDFSFNVKEKIANF